MKKEEKSNILILVEKYPELFFKENEKGERVSTLIPSGFPDGWFILVENLCANIDHYQTQRNDQIDRGNIEGEKVNVKVAQIKSKFRGLRFYFDGGDRFVAGMVRFAESMSFRTCMTCGHPASEHSDYAWGTYCDDCFDKRHQK